MRAYRLSVTFIIVLTLKHNVAKQWHNQNTDFLLHEAGLPASNPTIPKREYVAPQPTETTKLTDFPALGPSPSLPSPALSNPQPTWTTKSPGKRDYVAPIRPSVKPQTSKSDFPALGPASTSQTTARPLTSLQPSRSTQSSGKRDYVAANFPPLKPVTNTHQGVNKVKDLVNFYDVKSNQQNTPQQILSYSSFLQATTTKMPPIKNTPKPLSFSAVVAGSKQPTSGSTLTTTKPANTGAFNSPSEPAANGNRVSTTRPVVLPSSIPNSNQGSAGNSPTDIELQTLSEELLKRDANNAAKYITINYQEKTTSHSTEDKTPLPLLSVTPEAWNIPTIQKFTPLLDNYERDTLVNEYVTPQERNEENAFMDAIMSTTVIRHLMNFLKDKGYVTPDPRQQRDFLKQMWFGLYSRGKGKLSSSGFEHIFVSELKNNQVSGLHNWIYFAREEQANRLNYLGYLKYADLGDKGAVIKLHLNQQGVDKPVDAIFVGTSPELEMALYTLCFVTRVDNDCNIKLAGKDVNINAYNFRYRSKNYIGSAFPQI